MGLKRRSVNIIYVISSGDSIAVFRRHKALVDMKNVHIVPVTLQGHRLGSNGYPQVCEMICHSKPGPVVSFLLIMHPDQAHHPYAVGSRVVSCLMGTRNDEDPLTDQ